MTRILDRYVYKEMGPPFIIGVGVFTFFLVIDRIYQLTDLVITKSVPFALVLPLLMYMLPAFLALTLPMALLAAAGASIGEWIHDMTFYFPGVDLSIQLAYGAWMLASGILFAGLGSWYLVRLLRPTGVLDAFPSGRRSPEAAT